LLFDYYLCLNLKGKSQDDKILIFKEQSSEPAGQVHTMNI